MISNLNFISKLTENVIRMTDYYYTKLFEDLQLFLFFFFFFGFYFLVSTRSFLFFATKLKCSNAKKWASEDFSWTFMQIRWTKKMNYEMKKWRTKKRIARKIRTRIGTMHANLINSHLPTCVNRNFNNEILLSRSECRVPSSEYRIPSAVRAIIHKHTKTANKWANLCRNRWLIEKFESLRTFTRMN